MLLTLIIIINNNLGQREALFYLCFTICRLVTLLQFKNKKKNFPPFPCSDGTMASAFFRRLPSALSTPCAFYHWVTLLDQSAVPVEPRAPEPQTSSKHFMEDKGKLFNPKCTLAISQM